MYKLISNLDFVGDLERYNEVDSQSGCIYTLAESVGILDGDRERHLDHNPILSQ